MGTPFLALAMVVIAAIAIVVYCFLPSGLKAKVDRYFCIED